jgi:uncharacterized membrane protein
MKMETEKIARVEDVELMELFRLGMLWRIVYGALKVLLGAALLHLHGRSVVDVFYTLMRHEITKSPRDPLVRFVHDWLTHVPWEITYFLAAYFIFWGAVDIILSVCLLQRRLWAYPVAGALIALFIIYSIARYTHTHSALLPMITVTDAFILALIVREYLRLRRGHAPS